MNFKLPILLGLLICCSDSHKESEQPQTREKQDAPIAKSQPVEPRIIYENPEVQSNYETLIGTGTSWIGQLGTVATPAVRFEAEKVYFYPEGMTVFEGNYTPTVDGVELTVEGEREGHLPKVRIILTGKCKFRVQPHPFEYQKYIECSWHKSCQGTDDHGMACELPRRSRFFDPTSRQPPGQFTQINGQRVVTLAPSEKTTTEDAFIRLSPSINAKYATDLLTCGSGENTPDRYETGSTFTLIARTVEKDTVNGRSDHWFYGLYGASDCAYSWPGRGWIFGALLE